MKKLSSDKRIEPVLFLYKPVISARQQEHKLCYSVPCISRRMNDSQIVIYNCWETLIFQQSWKKCRTVHGEMSSSLHPDITRMELWESSILTNFNLHWNFATDLYFTFATHLENAVRVVEHYQLRSAGNSPSLVVAASLRSSGTLRWPD